MEDELEVGSERWFSHQNEGYSVFEIQYKYLKLMYKKSPRVMFSLGLFCMCLFYD
jgi:hypothetical protein